MNIPPSHIMEYFGLFISLGFLIDWSTVIYNIVNDVFICA